MNFGQALEAIKQGKKVARKGWNGKGMYIALMEPHIDYKTGIAECFKDIAKKTDIENPYGSNLIVDVDPYIVMRTAQKTIQPGWLASQADMLAEDWGIIE